MEVTAFWWLMLVILVGAIIVISIQLSLVVAAARRVDEQTAALWTAAKQIAGNTVSIWTLEKVNRQLCRILDTTRSLEHIAASIDGKLHVLAGRGNGRG
jgi:hypothetical protein